MSKAIYPHTDLLNVAWHLLEGIELKNDAGIENGIALECIACVVMCAAACEGLINAVGPIRLDNWKERKPTSVKMKRICSSASIEFDEDAEPFQTLKQLRDFRDSIMHCQPESSNINEAPADESNPLDADWQKYMTPGFCREAYEAVKQFQRTVFTNLEINAQDMNSIRIWDYTGE